MGNPGLPNPRVTDLSSSLSFSLLPPFLFFLSLTVLPSFTHSFTFIRSCLLYFLHSSYSFHFFSLFLCQFSFISILLSIVNLNDIFGRKFRSNREKHFTLSGFLLSLFARIQAILPFFIGLFVNNCDARRIVDIYFTYTLHRELLLLRILEG